MTPEEKKENYRLVEELLPQQNFQNAVIFGIAATLAGAIIWALVAAAAGYVVSFVPVALGAFVGSAIRVFGKGLAWKFVVLAAALTIVGCIMGNVMAVILIEWISYNIPISEILRGITAESLIGFLIVEYQLIDAVAWVVAISVAASTAKRKLSREQSAAMYMFRNQPKQ